MDLLKSRRGAAKSVITRAATYVLEKPLGSAGITFENYQARRDILETAFSAFSKIHDSLSPFMVIEADIAENEDYFVRVEETFLETKATLNRFINSMTAEVQVNDHNETLNDTVHTTMRGSNVHVRLPALTIQSFSGDYKDWTAFSDIFISTIHSNTNLSNAQKMQYLVSSLKDDALQLIRHFSVTNSNYEEAWNKLKDRYNKKKQIVQAHISRFLNQSKVMQPSASKIRQMYNTSDEVIRALKAVECESRDAWLVFILVSKLDSETVSLWAEKSVATELPTLDDFFKFLDQRCYALESVQPTSASTPKSEATKSTNKIQTHHVAPTSSNTVHKSKTQSQTNSSPGCLACSGSHHISRCTTFKSWDVKSRRDFARTKHLCYNCLQNSHSIAECKNSKNCFLCNSRHHTLLHQELSPSRPGGSEDNSSSGIVANFTSGTDVGTLPTAIVTTKDKFGNDCSIRALIDSGSQVCLISESCMQRLGIARTNARIPVTALKGAFVGHTRGKAKLEISSIYDKNSSIQIEAYVLNQLTGLIPSKPLSLRDMEAIKNIQLADPNFNDPSSIDVIIGWNKFLAILRNGQINNDNGEPIAQNTMFGYVIAGTLKEESPELMNFHVDLDLDASIRKFWETEEIFPPIPLTKEEEYCEKHFQETFSRSASGRYIVRLPFKPNFVPLGESIRPAMVRLFSIEKRFDRDAIFKKTYTDFMNEYLICDHLEEIPDHEVSVKPACYMPHHAVVKADSLTTKLRVVFDGSSKSSSGVSLNETLLVGPTIQSDLFTSILRYRTHQFAFVTDIEKMYRQIEVHPDDRNFQRIIWRDSKSDPIKHYRLKTVTYGTACAPFLATRALNQLAIDNSKQFPAASAVIKRDFYVDDLMSGSNTLEDALILQMDVIKILESGGFKLRKWAANHVDLLSHLPETHRQMEIVDMSDTITIKTLGLYWLPNSDLFSFQVKFPVQESKITKRVILSEASKLFDPLGWLAPSIVQAKILFQQLWLCNLLWDDVVPPKVAEQWIIFRSQLKELEKVTIPRWIPIYNNKLELHGFCDASESAFAASIYSRSEAEDGKFHVNLVAGKTRVAPLKALSIPRLELNGAVLVTRLMKKIISALELLGNQHYTVYLWTDSTIVLSWFGSHPRRWSTFIANRTSEVLDLFPASKWFHVASENNPADCASRGVNPSDLHSHSLWWSGPEFLYEKSENWPEQKPTAITSLEEKKTTIQCNTTSVSNPPEILTKFSDLQHIIRVTAWCIRFSSNAQLPANQRKSGCLSTDELHQAIAVYIRWAQQEDFSTEIQCLRNEHPVQTRSKIQSLNPFLDKNGILRVGGRLEQANIPYEAKHPIILPKKNLVTKLIIESTHKRLLHANYSLLSSMLSQRYWIIGQRSLIKEIIHQCVLCFRLKPQNSTQMMGNLPAARVTPTRAFFSTGCDFAGPITIKNLHGRGSKKFKAYIAVFICFSTKAVHLEAVSSLTTDAFISSLKRLIGRRGHPHDIYCDNGTNFVGAKRSLTEMQVLMKQQNNQLKIDQFLSTLDIRWHFNPPAAPHFGGLWEAAVKSTKHHLKRVLFNFIPTFEELSTILIQIEACLNSRPLCALSGNSDNFDVLTPAHFLIGEPLITIQEADLNSVPLNRLDRWQMCTKIVSDFWNRWAKEYLTTLQPRTKWTKPSDDINVGDLVLIKDKNLPPTQWILARVEILHPGQDKKVRVVTLKHKNGSFQRPIHVLCKLPIN